MAQSSSLSSAALEAPNLSHRPEELVFLAKEILKARWRRNVIFGADAEIFGEPAWDILLDLYAQPEAHHISITSACIAARVPATTALRHIRKLQDIHLIQRHPDESDRRKNFLTLTPRGKGMVQAWLQMRLTETCNRSRRGDQPEPKIEYSQIYSQLSEGKVGVAIQVLTSLIEALSPPMPRLS